MENLRTAILCTQTHTNSQRPLRAASIAEILVGLVLLVILRVTALIETLLIPAHCQLASRFVEILTYTSPQQTW